MGGPEHMIMGALLAHLGFHQRWGARITAVMVAASVVPDADALTYLAGRQAFFRYHRTVSHSLGGAVAAALAVVALCRILPVLARALDARWHRDDGLRRLLRSVGEREANPLLNAPLVFGASFVAMAAHILVDTLYPWPMPLLWPFHGGRFCLGVLDWGDPAMLLVMVAAMFALGIFRRRSMPAAAGSLVGLAAYVCARLALSPWPLMPVV